ncbi:hypothetical protein NCPPB940_13250 [Xanthomonas hortorum pv. taraxaci]|nr:hypothetical protein NCPPB940_13250 [Xanthomonas hortorum pv. taraxaci]CAD0315949.1 hypothetical protein NCPPB940_13250 [Xanthomonas hortorum pv. taraxaci]
MKKSKFTEEQIAFALKQAETGTMVEESPQGGYQPSHVPSVCIGCTAKRASTCGANVRADAKPQHIAWNARY